MASSATFQVSRCFGAGVHDAKIDFGKLYLRQLFGKNQSDVIEANAATGLGKTTVNNWEIYDGIGSEATLVAYGKGMHTYADDWQNWFTMVFEVERFKGSTLQIMGASIGKSNEWAIVGGTGDFAMAQGVIRRNEHTLTADEQIQELTIDGLCRMNLPPVPSPTKNGPWGGNGGALHEMQGKSQRLASLRLQYTDVIDAISFTYLNEDEEIRTAGRWGGQTTFAFTEIKIKFAPWEYVKEINGTVGEGGYVSNLKIVTNVKTYGPFGTRAGPPFNFIVPEDKTVVGFFANTGPFTNSIGVYTI